MQTNNLMSNLMIEGTTKFKATEGMGATVCGYSDRYAATIIQVMDVRGKTYIKVQQDHARRTDDNGMSEMQDYEYTRDPNGTIFYFRFNEKKTAWESVYQSEETGRWRKSQSGYGLVVGHRREYYDFTF